MQLPTFREYHIPHVQGVPIEGRRLPLISMRTDEKRRLIEQIAQHIESSGSGVSVEHRWTLSQSDGRSYLLDLGWGAPEDDFRLALAFDPQMNGVPPILELIRETGVAVLTTHPVTDESELADRVGLVVAGLSEGMPPASAATTGT